MPPLAEVQARIRDALVVGACEPVLQLLADGDAGGKRLAIHQRHYQASLVAALLGKFPGTVWLVGERFVVQAACAFVRKCPPAAPCIAEYGESFPRFLASHPDAIQLPYLQSYAQLEWHLGRIALAVERPAITMDALAAVDADLLPEAGLELQPGVIYFSASWPVDELIELFLSGTHQQRFALQPALIALELRGARGSFQIRRLDPATFAFRAAITARKPIGVAAERALAADPTFEPGRALATLLAENVVTAVVVPSTRVSR